MKVHSMRKLLIEQQPYSSDSSRNSTLQTWRHLDRHPTVEDKIS